MNKHDIARRRLANQQISATAFTRPEKIVRWFGAMQAQDYGMAKWALGVRLPGAIETDIERALETGKILRTHIMRPTWHFVAAEDMRWLIALSALQLRSTSAAAFRQFGLDAETCRRSNDLIARALEGGNHLTRREIVAELAKAGIEANNYQAAYLMFNAEIDAVVCSGVGRGKEQTYALLDERVPQTVEKPRDEAIAELTRRYFTSHAPATLKDFVWWSGLPTADARRGLEMNKSVFVSREIEGEIYWMPAECDEQTADSNSLYLLPAFDEYMVSYKDRTAALETGSTKEAITGNGIFKPIIVAGGKVTGVWKRTVKKDSLRIEKMLFDESNHFDDRAFASKAREYALFEGKSLV